ncbi:T9SS type A sorting domain-containing protein [Hymenobacter endophyticus]|uniref:T9SS type A sorting domain-containing protein n=1 Tax=Hymenobacter endophyticus TaxID=3076335 RepID=A0ABU3TJJ5_9BACT|nr:T9SS type A sorting domain-containing protein [Hymenobacter endophyticus]MDU0371538.1 T9SS type A sorting domain-containing protein [Hymenobacter endophyticus]
MKKQFTLAALGLLTATSFSASAQITLDGKVTATEIGTGANKYQLASTYTGTHSVAGKGLQTLYVGSSSTKLYVMIVGSAETATDYPGYVLYLNVPGKTGVAAGTQLKGGSAGDSPLKHTPTMDMETDYGVRATLSPSNMTDVYYSFVDYTAGNTAPVSDSYQGAGKKDGTALTFSATTGPFTGARTALMKSTDLTAATAAGTGLEMEFDLAAMGLTATSQINLMVGYVKDGGAFTSDVLPQVVGQTADLGSSPDFSTLTGRQNVTYNLTTGILANRNAVASALKFSVYPNPSSEAATIDYVVSGQQDVALDVFNSLGQRVRSVASGKQNGAQSFPLDNLTAGAYLVKLRVGDQSTSQKVVIQ